MTTINPAVGNFQANFATAVNGAALTLAAGVMGSFIRPLGASAFASARLPSAWNLSLGSVSQPQTPAFTATVQTGGKAQVDLGDGYKLDVNENNSEINIINSRTGETTKIWGDPHVDVDGKHAFDFWGTTTFTLENGTKVTINTEQWNGNPDAYVASEVVVTKGDQAATIKGVSQNSIGDLSVTTSTNGRALDAATRDGYTLHENATGSGWRTEIGTMATQADLNHTKVGADYGPGSRAPSLGEMGPMINLFLTFGALSAFAALSTGPDAATTDRAQHRHIPA